ncbi:MAG TPA: methyltransferase domain-containing protein [Solirubrobacteraceae bacterium]|nr:methyltransferase domain-containing protein [Solirubrobacteraceae bacterium]
MSPVGANVSGASGRKEAAVGFDANEYREASLAGWEEAAAGWRRQREAIDALGMPVARWMLDAAAPAAGERVLELAAGNGEIGLMAARMVGEAGSVIVSDQAEAMVAAARERGAELGVENVEFRVLGGEWIDLPLASVQVVLCRWGYMLMADPAAALAETRRVLAPGGRLALAVWDGIQENPWAALPGAVLLERGLVEPPNPGVPGPFALGDAERVRGLLAGAGFAEIDVQALEVTRRQGSFEEFWQSTLDISRGFHDAVMSQRESEIEEIRQALAARLEPFTSSDGGLEIPGRTLVASASA